MVTAPWAEALPIRSHMVTKSDITIKHSMIFPDQSFTPWTMACRRASSTPCPWSTLPCHRMPVLGGACGRGAVAPSSRGSVSRAEERTRGRSRPPARPAGRRTHGHVRVMLPWNALHAACTVLLHSCDLIGWQGSTLLSALHPHDCVEAVTTHRGLAECRPLS